MVLLCLAGQLGAATPGVAPTVLGISSRDGITPALGSGARRIFPITISTTNAPRADLLLITPSLNPDGSFQFSFEADPGVAYTIQYSTNLTTWISSRSFPPSPGGQFVITEPNAGYSRCYYRVKIGP